MNRVDPECRRCGIQLPLKLAGETNDRQSLWACANCGCEQAGTFDETARPGIRHNAFRIDPASRLSRPPSRETQVTRRRGGITTLL